MIKYLITSGFFGGGVGIGLLYSNQQLPYQAYLVNIPIWMSVVLPSGLLWKQKFLNKINQGQFPADMKNYRQLFLTSRKAIIYDFFLNQCGYHMGLGMILIYANYWARRLYDNETKPKPFSQIAKKIVLGYVKLRAFFTVFGYLSQFWISKALLQKKQGKYTMNPQSRRLLFMKQTLIQLGWMSSIMNMMHNQYPEIAKSQ